MARPSKPVDVLTKELKSHRTKAELKARECGEKALATGTAFVERREVKRNKVAHTEFKRLNELLSSIGKNDAIYGTVINRYCIILAECADFELKREKIFDTASMLENKLNKLDDQATFTEARDAANDIARIYRIMIDIDKQIESKRKMLLSIEKENIMTVAAALRSVPKAPDKKENLLLKALNGDAD